ncbi:hypothetical protein CBR_g41533 [Chara braunii]|uniref:Biogenesis of lysosome-related organelles complex 1 subunit 7 n=1 Tax=Chara braunii TaxID=69332 RepID=A0A388K2P8_CHABU|nr:hypothetical protein CBR_g41533 [Chara braunii]|eukprot:GBG64332.1 hypothetical protein CBR_g41533 [Chara braunii]
MAIRALTGVQQASSSSSSPSSSSSSSPGSLVCAPTLFSPTSSSITFSTPSPISPSAQPTDNTPPPPPLPGSSGVDQVAGVSRRLDFQSAGSGRSGSVAGIRAGEGALSSAIVPPGGTSSLHSSSSSYFSTTSGGVASTSAKLASIHLSPTSPPSVASARYQTTAGTSRPNCPHSGAGDGSAKATTREGGCDCESSTSSGRSTSASRSQTLGSALDAAHNLVGGRSGSSSLAMAEGLASLLGPIVREFDANAQSAMRSQERLTVNIGRLTAELDKLLEDTPIPHVSQHAAKLAGIRKRVVALTSTLRLIQARIGSMNSILNKKAVMDQRSGELDEAYQSRMLAWSTETKKRADDAAAAVKKKAEDVEQARLLAQPRETTPKFDGQEIFFDSTKTDPVPWFRKFELTLQLHNVQEHKHHAYLYSRSGVACRAWLDNLLSKYGVVANDLHTKISWDDLKAAWDKRFQVEPPKIKAMDKLMVFEQGTLPSSDWIAEYQRLTSVPDIQIGFKAIRHYFISRSCPTLSNALTRVEDTLTTMAELFDKAVQIIITNKEVKNLRSSATGPSRDQHRPRVAVVAAATPEERGEVSGTKEDDRWREKKISEWVANLSLGEDEEAQLYVPQEEREALALIEDPLERQTTEDEKKLEWKLKMMREKKRREEASRIAGEVERVRTGRQELQAQTEVFAKLDKMMGFLEILSEAWMEEHQARKGQEVTLQAMRSGFREFAGDVVGHVGAEVRRLRDGVDKFCAGAIKTAKVVASTEATTRPRKELVKLKFPDPYSGKKEENFDNWEANPSLPFVVTTSARQYGIGAVLQQDDDNGCRPVEFMLARMPSEKVATSTYERELYALRQALEHWKHYLRGRHFKVYSDHETLRWLKTQAKMTPKLTRWAAEIDQYDFELKPVKGKYNVVADALSRRSDYFGAIVYYLDIGSDLQEKVRQAYAHDPIYSDLLKKVKEAPETEPDYRLTEGQSGSAACPDPAAAAAAAAANGSAGNSRIVAVPSPDPAMAGPSGSFAYIDRKATRIPSKYDGKDDIESWISSMRSYFDVLGTPPSTQSSILGTNVEPVVRGFLETQAVQSGYKRIDMNKWLKATPTTTLEDLLIKQYVDPHAAAKARLKLDKLKHNKWTGTMHSLQQYVNKLFATPDLEMTAQSCLDVIKARLARRSVPRGGVSRHSFNSSSSSRTTAVGKASLTSTPIPMQQRATGSTPAHGHHRARSLDEVFSVGSHDDEFWTITMSDDEHADGRRAGDHQHAVQLEKKKRGPDKLLLNRSHGKGMSEQSKGRGEWSNGRTTAQYLNANADPPGQSGEGLTLSGSIGRYGSGTAKWPTGLDNPRVSAGGIGRGHESHPVMSNNVSMLQTRGLEKGGGISERSFSSGKNNEPLSRSVAEIRKPVWERGVRVVRGIQRLRESIAADGDSLGLGLGLEFQVGGDEGHRRARASTPSGRSGNSSLQTIARDRGPPPMSTAKGSITQAASAADYSADGEITLDEDPGGPGMESMAGSTRGGKAAEIQPVATRRNESTNYIGSEMVRESHAWRGADRRLDNRGPTGVVVGRDPGSNRWGELRRDSAESPGTLEINRSGAREFGDTYPIRHGSNSFQGGPESGLHRGAEMWSDKDGGIGVDI